MPTTRVDRPEDIGVSDIVIAGPPGVRIVPAISIVFCPIVIA